MRYKTGLEATNENLFFTLAGRSIIKWNRESAQTFVDRMSKWAEKQVIATDGTIVGLNGVARFIGTDAFMTVLYNNYPVLRMDHDQARRFAARIQAWIDEPKMKPVDKIIREIRQAEKELKEYGGDLDIAGAG